MSLENKEIFNSSEKIKSNSASKEDLKKAKKSKQLKKKRLIIRNLSFKVSEEELKKIFSKFGEVLDVNIPLKEDGKKKGFAFIQFKKTADQIKAMKTLNFQKINGRPIAIDFAVDKTTYQSNRNNIKSSDLKNTDEPLKTEEDEDHDSISDKKSEDSISDGDEDEGETKVKKFLKEFDAYGSEDGDNSENDSSSASSKDSDFEEETTPKNRENTNDVDDYSDDDKKSNKEENGIFKKSFPKTRRSADVSEGKTVFIRNVSFKTNEEDLEEVVQEYGETAYCLLCTDPLSGHSKGTAFVKFNQKESAEKFIEESNKEPGILLDGRRLNCTLALSKEEVEKRQKEPEKMKDKRNLRLLKYGLITYGSTEAEGVSQTDMAKRAQLEMAKKQKLKNVNFFVSDKRLMIHNLPKTVNDKDLYKMFKNAASKDAVIKEARVMRDFKKTDAQGVPASRGFGFVAFTEHEHALQALMELNNNPKIFTPNKRPIVEFSVENKVALLSKERRKEKMKMRSKRKQEERENENNEKRYEEELQKSNTQRKENVSRKKRKHSKPQTESLSKKIANDSSDKPESSPKKKKCKKSRKNRFQNAEWKSSLQASTEKYKAKLNKLF